MEAAKFLLAHPRACLEGVIAAFFLLAASILSVQNGHLLAKVAKRNVLIGQLTTANQNFKTPAETQNAAVEAWQREAQERERQARQAVAAAEKKAARHAARAAELLGRTASGDECQATKALLQDYYGSRP